MRSAVVGMPSRGFHGGGGLRRVRAGHVEQEQMARIATLDTGSSLFFDHHDPEIVAWLAGRRLDA
ncbi:hypothetical protein [Streptomyces sp. NPDC059900]|uniref:hypothetical protein n=2 Tax=Streptomyces sp. NPDC059900 TaxID=3155816 RepID=UPI003D003A8C